MVLLAAVTLISAAVAGGATLVGSPATGPSRIADRTFGYAPSAASFANPTSSNPTVINASDRQPVRVVGAPFVPNTNPRER